MSITNISSEHLNNLMIDLNLNELSKQKIVDSVQRNSNNYGKLKTLFKQLEFIKKEIEGIVLESIESNELDNVSCRFKRIPGNTYYLYRKKDGDLFFSMLEPEIWDWGKNNIFIGNYLFDYDLTWNKV